MKDDPEDGIEELFPDPADENGETDGISPAEQEVAEKASKAARKLEPAVLAHVLHPNYQPVKPRVIAKQLNLPSELHKALKLAIKRLAKAGKVTYGAGHLVKAPKAKKQEPSGRSQGTGNRRQATDNSPPVPPSSPRDTEPRVASSASTRDSKNIVVGTFRRTARGFGFVRPQGSRRGDRSGDKFASRGR